jgi:hypothetical protein
MGDYSNCCKNATAVALGGAFINRAKATSSKRRVKGA